MGSSCDWKVDSHRCGKPARVHRESIVGNTKLVADLCADHDARLREALVWMGFRPHEKNPNWKYRATHTAASGQTFTSAEAREWLIEQGIIEHSVGRVSRAHLRLYAQEH